MVIDDCGHPEESTMVDGKIGRYEILSLIGRGGMAAVYRAGDPEGDQDVAIKLLAPEYFNDLGFRARFEREAQTIATLDHPAIVPLFEFGQHEGQLFIVMPYMPGGSLADRLVRGPVTVQEAAAILARIGPALDYAHGQGLVHRDLKPSNILFDRQDDAFLADFGIALQASTGQDRLVPSGTPAYMSPEQARQDKEIDYRSDLYSLGVTLFETVTGSLPFESGDSLALLLKRLQDSPPSPSEINPELPSALGPVFNKLLLIDPAQRYQTAAAFTGAFYQACDLDYAGEAVPDVPLAETPSPAPHPEKGETAEPSLPEGETGPNFAMVEPILVWLGDRPLIALAVVTILGILSAFLLVFLIRGPGLFSSGSAEPTLSPVPNSLVTGSNLTRVISPTVPAAGDGPEANISLVYTDAAVTLTNASTGSISLEDLVFRRPLAGEAGELIFPASIWQEAVEQSALTLPPGDCYQLLNRANTPPASMLTPVVPPTCNLLQAWVVADDEDWRFWVPESAGNALEVIQGDQLIHSCSLDAGTCRFYLPQPMPSG
jgi:serine/threonine protein kinase